jgi:serine/threonine protein kinase
MLKWIRKGFAPLNAMAFTPEKDAEPIPGYRLVEKLGSGGYGEVWKATAPGGLTKAIKFIFGDVSGAQAEQELKALHRVKEVRHPFLLSLERIEVIHGGLVIVTELADGCLQDRYAACRQAGLWGIPRAELLGYLRDTAEALDYMRETHGLQHLDIKPQNLLLVGGRVKVADFGLVKELTSTSVTATGGVTPVYAPPEAFDGRVSRFSDQYSLAIVYQEMLTGLRPFPGRTAMQLAAQHTSSPPLLDPLPPADRPVIARALAKLPEARFPTCLEMVENLRHGAPSAPPPASWTGSDSDSAVGDVATVVSPRNAAASSTAAVEKGPSSEAEATFRPGGVHPAPFQPSAARTGLRPTLFLGIGGLACATLRRLRQRLGRRFGTTGEMPIFRLLLVDTDRTELRQAHQGEGGEALDTRETFLAPLHPPEYYRPQAKTHLRWLDRRWLYGIPRSLQTEGLRPLGRLALVDNAAELLPRIREALAAIASPEAAEVATAQTGQPLRDLAPRVFVLASITGGTGSGMVLGMAYAVRQALADLGLPANGLCGLLLHATSPKPSEQEMGRANTYATLNELDHFSQAEADYPGDPEFGLLPFGPKVPPFEECYLIRLGDGLSKDDAAATTSVVADYLELDATATGGSFLDNYRRSTHVAPDGNGGSVALRSFGLFRITAPGPRLAGLTSDLLCGRIIDRWLGTGEESDTRRFEAETQRKLALLGLDEKTLQARFQAVAATALGENPESYFAKMAGPFGADQGPPTAEMAGQFLKKIHAVLGTGPELHDRIGISSTALETTVQGQARDLANNLGPSLVEELGNLVETPGSRLRVADALASALIKNLAVSAERVEGQLASLRGQRVALKQQLAGGNHPTKGSGLRWLGFRRSPENPPGPNRKFLDYCWLRWSEITLEAVAVVLGDLRGKLGWFVQELGTCRQKLTQLAASFHPALAARAPSATRLPAPNLLELLPNAAGTPEAAAESLLNSFPLEFLRRFEETFQREILQPHGGLWHVLGGEPLRERDEATPMPLHWSHPLRALPEELRARALAEVRRHLQERNAAQQFLDLQGGLENARKTLLAHAQAAQPNLKLPDGWEHLVAVLPPGPAADAMGSVLAHERPDVPMTVLSSEDDIFLCCEAAHYSLTKVAAALAGRASHADLAQRLMTRMDVSWKALAIVGQP